MSRNSLIGIAALIACAGCGGSPDLDDQHLDDSAENEVGSLEQAINAVSSPSFGFGITAAGAHTACLGTNAPANQDCLVPSSKTIKWCVDTGNSLVDAALAFDMSEVISGVPPLLPGLLTGTGWTFVHAADGASCALGVDGVNLEVNPGSGSCPGDSTGGDIENFVCYTPLVGGALSEGLPGTYNQQTGGLIRTDDSDISARAAAIGPGGGFTVGTLAVAIRRHGLAHSILGLMGLGARTDAASSSLWTKRAILPITPSKFISSGEQCRALNYSPAFPGAGYAIAPFCGSD